MTSARKRALLTAAHSAALLAFALSFAGCTKVDTAQTSGRHPYTHPHELRFAAASDIQQLNALINESQYEEYLNSMTEAWLIKTDAHGDPTVPELITEVPSQSNGGISRDGKTITWRLRHGVKWADGAAFDADDVVFTTRQVLNPANDVVSRDGWDLIVKIDEPDKYTVVYHLKSPYSAFADTFFSTAGANPCVLPKHLLAQYKNLNEVPYNSLPVGIGPFKYQAWNRGTSIVMVANPLYFRGRPKLDRITYYTVQDRNTVLEQFRTHDLDLWIPVPAHFYPEVAALPGTATSKIASLTFDHLDFNLRTPVLADVAVRRALRYALDRKSLNDKVANGLFLLDESPVTPASKYHIALPLVPFDLARANALLDSDGWVRGSDGIRAKSGRRLSLVLASATGSPDTDTRIELIRAAWKQLGVEFIVKRYPDSEFFAPAAEGGIIYGGKFDVVIFGWGAGPSEDQANLYACYRFTPDGQNDMHWCDRSVDAAILDAEHSYDEGVRAKDIATVQHGVYEQVPTVVMDARSQLAAYNDDLKNWHPNAVSPFDDMLNVDI
jgi:peptide/nickel transport system substrate-binding protein